MAEQIYSESATADEMDLGDTLRQLFCESNINNKLDFKTVKLGSTSKIDPIATVADKIESQREINFCRQALFVNYSVSCSELPPEGDKRTHIYREQTITKNNDKSYMNPPQKTPIGPNAQRLRDSNEITVSTIAKVKYVPNYQVDAAVLREKLEKIKREREKEEAQAILDKHISNVFPDH